MSRTNRNTRREPAERPFPYIPDAVPVTVQPADMIVWTTESRSTVTRIDGGYRIMSAPDPDWHDVR